MKTVSRRDRVVVAYCHPGEVTAHFHESLVNLLVYDAASRRHIVDGGGRLGFQSSANISAARNAMVRTFLAGDADWLWIVDTDMSFQPDTLDRLLETADPDKAPIVGGLCFGIEDGLLFPTLYDIGGTEDKVEFLRYSAWPEDTMFQVFGTGAACLLVHRSALEAIGARQFSSVFPWFQEREFNGTPMGEDLTFCMRAAACELPVFVHTGVQLGHVKSQVLTADGYAAQRNLIERTADPERKATVA